MFASGRIVATSVFLGRWVFVVVFQQRDSRCRSIVVTIIVAVQTKSVLGVALMLVVQFFAGLWYTLSYIPGARALVLNCCRAATGV